MTDTGATGTENVPSNVTDSAVVDGPDDAADTKVKVEDAVVAKAPDGKEIDFKKISIKEALDALQVSLTAHPGLSLCQPAPSVLTLKRRNTSVISRVEPACPAPTDR